MKVSKTFHQRLREFDLVIFGASGFTGKHVVDYMCSKPDLNKYKIAFAGQCIERIKNVTKDHHDKNIPIIQANVHDGNSMKNLTKRTSVLLNCVGPYQLFGEPVVRTCLDTRTHHLDVSGEPFYLESVQFKYHQEAVAKETLIIGSCGFDSVPADLGIQLMINKFGSKNIESINTYLHSKSSTKRGNHATWVSIITGYSNQSQLKYLRSKIFDSKFYSDGKNVVTDIVPNTIESMSRGKRRGLHYKYGNYNLPFPGSDRSVVRRSQMLNLISDPNYVVVPVEIYFGFESLFNFTAFRLAFGAINIKLLKGSEKGRQLLIDHAPMFTFGLFNPNVNPSMEELKKCSFNTRIVATVKKISSNRGDHDEQSGSERKKGIEEQKMESKEEQKILLITGPDPGYRTAAICLIESALSVLNERKLIPVNGGVITPGYAFSQTSLINRLNENGIVFKFLDNLSECK